MKKLILLSLITIVSCGEQRFYKGWHGIKHKIYVVGVNEFYSTTEIKYKDGCATFYGMTYMDDRVRSITICGSFIQEY